MRMGNMSGMIDFVPVTMIIRTAQSKVVCVLTDRTCSNFVGFDYW